MNSLKDTRIIKINKNFKLFFTSSNMAYLVLLRCTQMLRTSDDADTLYAIKKLTYRYHCVSINARK